jgi:HPt (histidine-containing phosphotransfer) domain-containing protein
MITVEKLESFGANTEEGLARCMKNEALYLRLVSTVPGEVNFGMLQSALEAKDLKEAFEAAHALKGVAGNLALDPLYDAICEIVEPLRAGEDRDYTEAYKKVTDARDRLIAII